MDILNKRIPPAGLEQQMADSIGERNPRRPGISAIALEVARAHPEWDEARVNAHSKALFHERKLPCK